MGAFYCSICRKTDFTGKGHIHGKSHQSKLKVVLVKFMEKVSLLTKLAEDTVTVPPNTIWVPKSQIMLEFYCIK